MPSSSPNKSLSIYYQNVRGLNTKTTSFYKSCCSSDFNIICITESWLGNSTFSAELFPSNYNVVRCDRKHELVNRSRGGGVIMAFSEDITFIQLDTTHLSTLIPLIDIVICKCMYPYNFVICLLYAPPDISSEDFELFLNALELTLLNTRCLIIGDFNDPHFCKNLASPSAKTSSLQLFCNVLELNQRNNIFNTSGKILDLVFTNTQCPTTVSHYDQSLVPEDGYHPALNINIELSALSAFVNFDAARTASFNFRKANFINLYNVILSTNWTWLEDINDVNQAIEEFYSALNDIFNVTVPRKTNNSKSARLPLWFSPELRRNLKIKERTRKKWIRSKQQKHLTEYKRLRKITKMQVSLDYDAYLQQVQTNIKTQPSCFWTHIHHKKGITRIPGLLYSNDEICDTPDTIVNAFANYFASTMTQSSSTGEFDVDSTNFLIYQSFHLHNVSEEDIISIMSKFSNKFTAGVDEIPSFLIRDCRFALAKPLSTIINLAIRTNTFPNRWKIARVTPVHKKGNKSRVENYRPISILSNFSKIFEQVIYSSLYHNTKQHLSQDQHGFMVGRSTVTNLASLTQYASEILDNQGQVDVIYTDFSKAFDSIDHRCLINKLDHHGLSNDFLALLRSYLSNRVSFVSYNGFQSHNFSMSSGVPQGSNLGPLLFNLFINDLLLSLSCPVLAYADDIKIYTSIVDSSDVLNLQENIDIINKWCHSNKLNLNVNKCYVMTYSRKLSPNVNNYKIDNSTLQRVSNIKDLGVLFDSTLSFALHIQEICKIAGTTLGFVLRASSEFSDPSVMKQLYYSFIISRLEYAAIVWNPLYACHITNIERIHRRFLKYLYFRFYGQYPEKGATLDEISSTYKLQSPSIRRQNINANFLRNILCNKVDCSYLMSKIPFQVPRLGSRNTSPFRLPTARTNLLLRSPIVQMCNSAEDVFDDIFI